MKREIKCRAWDEGNKIMHYDFQWMESGTSGNDWIVFKSDKQPNYNDAIKNPHFQHQLKKMQVTGIPDKNGKEIYEGDKCICRVYGTESHVEDVTTEVIYDLTVGAFLHKVVSEHSDYKFFGLNSKNIINSEIIGNIYETKKDPA